LVASLFSSARFGRITLHDPEHRALEEPRPRSYNMPASKQVYALRLFSTRDDQASAFQIGWLTSPAPSGVHLLGQILQPLVGWSFLAIHFKENSQRIVECLRFHRYYLRRLSASIVALMGDTRGLPIEHLCRFTHTTTSYRIRMSRYRPFSETIGSSFNDYRHRSCPCSTEAPAEVI
jgi:hypothetical protein